MWNRLRRLPPVAFLTALVRLYFARQVSRSAAALAYFLILSFFPVLLCVHAFIALLDLDLGALLAGLAPVLPGPALEVLEVYAAYLSQNQSPGLLAAGIAATLLPASAALRVLMNTLGEVYGRRAYRGLRQILASLLFSLLFLATVYLSIGVLFTGGWLYRRLGALFRLQTTLPPGWPWLRFLLLFSFVLFFVLLVYRLASPGGDCRPPLLPGAALAAGALVGASALFSWFMGLSARYSLVYGSLASVILLLVWLYLCGNILLLGGLCNSLLPRRG